MEELMTYMGYQWLLVEDNVITIGINDSGIEELTEISSLNLPEEGEGISPDEICGELETDDGPINIYSPVEGSIIEVNEAVIENPSLIIEDPTGDGWLFRVEATNAQDITDLSQGTSADLD